jgi:hypothetical protein
MGILNFNLVKGLHTCDKELLRVIYPLGLQFHGLGSLNFFLDQLDLYRHGFLMLLLFSGAWRRASAEEG